MKKAIIAVAIACLFMVSAGVVLAEGPKSENKPAPMMKMDQKENWQDKILDKMTADLGLTLAQRDKAAVIINESETKGKALMDKMREDMKVLREASEQKMKAILTEEQVQKYDQLTQNRQQKMGDAKEKGEMGPEGKPKGTK